MGVGGEGCGRDDGCGGWGVVVWGWGVWGMGCVGCGVVCEVSLHSNPLLIPLPNRFFNSRSGKIE